MLSNLAEGLPGLCDYSRVVLPPLLEGFAPAEPGPAIPGLDECARRDNGVHDLGLVNWNGNADDSDELVLEGVTAPNRTTSIS